MRLIDADATKKDVELQVNIVRKMFKGNSLMQNITETMLKGFLLQIDKMPSIEPELTLETAIEYLQKIGWMQEHDRILSEEVWIPVTERLPEKTDEYLVTAEVNGRDGIKRLILSAYYTKTDGWKFSSGKVIAWKPMPEIYKEDL